MSERLIIGGEVTAPQTLDFDTLRALSEQIAAVQLDTLLAIAGVTPTPSAYACVPRAPPDRERSRREKGGPHQSPHFCCVNM